MISAPLSRLRLSLFRLWLDFHAHSRLILISKRAFYNSQPRIHSFFYNKEHSEMNFYLHFLRSYFAIYQVADIFIVYS
jgi:hypothetical protein